MYEMNFKRFIKKIEKVSNFELEYWEHFSKKDIDVSRIDRLGSQIIHSYERYMQLANDFKTHCGDILALETV